jgi:hypothetical protein
LHDGQPQTHASAAIAARIIQLIKLFEYSSLLAQRNAFARIGDTQNRK